MNAIGIILNLTKQNSIKKHEKTKQSFYECNKLLIVFIVTES